MANLACDQCSNEVPDEYQLSIHIATEHPPCIKCDNCQFTALSQQELLTHANQEHKGEETETMEDEQCSLYASLAHVNVLKDSKNEEDSDKGVEMEPLLSCTSVILKVRLKKSWKNTMP